MSEPLRTVLVGFGQIAAGYAQDTRTAQHFPYATHAQVLTDHPAFSWETVVDPSPEALTSARERWDVRHTFKSIEDAAALDPEVAVIATPPQARLQILEELPSLRAVLVEKPLGLDVSESERFLEACRRRRILVQVNLWRRADETFRRLAAGELVELIGRPLAAFGLYGNGLLNNGTHMIDFVRFMLGDVETARLAGPPRPDETLAIRGDVNVAFDLRLGQGMIASFQPLPLKPYRENGLDIWGEQGRLSIMNEGLCIVHYPRDDHRAMQGEREIACDRGRVVESTAGRALYRLYDNLAAAVNKATSLWCSGETAMETARVVQEIMQAVHSDRDLHLSRAT